MHPYVISGLRVLSDIAIPSAQRQAPFAADVDVRIHAGPVPAALENAIRTGPDWDATEDELLLRIAGVARVLVRAGREIVYQSEPAADRGDLTLYLLGSCFATLLQQRGFLVLHASAVAVGDRAALFCGPSGAGKSTLAAMLSQQGFPLLNDDVCSLRLAEDGFRIAPDGRMLKLWAASLDHLHMHSQRGRSVRDNTEKFYTRPAAVEESERLVAAIYMLEPSLGNGMSLDVLSLTESMVSLRMNSYRPALVDAMNQNAFFFRATAALQRSAAVYRFRRPLGFNYADETVTTLKRHWAETLGYSEATYTGKL